MRYFVAALAIISAVKCLAAQPNQDIKETPTAEVSSVVLEFGKPEPTPLGKQGTVVAANYGCASDGSVFLQIADSPSNLMLELHSLKNASEDIRYSPGHIRGYGTISFPLNFFENDKYVATLVEAEYEKNPLEKNKSEGDTAHLVLIYDRKGALQHVVPIPSELDAKAIGLYGSGDLLIAAINKSTKAARLVVMDTRANIKTEFFLFDNDYNSSKEAKDRQPLAKLIPGGALAFLQIVSDGENLLLIPRTTSQAVIEVNEAAVVRSVQLQLPPGQTLNSFLSISDSSWKIKSFAKTDENGILHEGPVFEFNPSDGSVIRRIDLPQGTWVNLACEHDGEYTALTTDRDMGRLELLRGHVPR